MNTTAEYLQASSPQSADELVASHAPLVKRIALHLMARLPSSVDVDDLYQSGMIGLLEAAQNFDPGAGASFETFAGFRIRGAMIDELRRGDWAPRSVHRKMRDAAEAMRSLEQELGRAPSEAEIAERLEMPVDEYQSLMADASRCQALSIHGEDEDGDYVRFEPADDTSGPEAAAEDRDFRHSLARAIKALPERDQLVLSLYYNEELNLKEIGAVLGVSESRVCQLHGRATLRLRAELGDWTQLDND